MKYRKFVSVFVETVIWDTVQKISPDDPKVLYQLRMPKHPTTQPLLPRNFENCNFFSYNDLSEQGVTWRSWKRSEPLPIALILGPSVCVQNFIKIFRKLSGLQLEQKYAWTDIRQRDRLINFLRWVYLKSFRMLHTQIIYFFNFEWNRITISTNKSQSTREEQREPNPKVW